VPDMKLLAETLDNVIVDRPKPTVRARQHLCADKGYDFPVTRLEAINRGYRPHIKFRRDEREAKIQGKPHPARRWVVERSHSWLNRFRRIVVRWEKKARNYDAMLAFACSTIVFRMAGVLG
jgi:putative transposase